MQKHPPKNFCCKMSKITKTMKNGLQLWVQKVTWAGTQCSEFSPQARLILCQYMDNFAALVLNCFYILNILIRIAWTSLFHCSHDFMPVLYITFLSTIVKRAKIRLGKCVSKHKTVIEERGTDNMGHDWTENGSPFIKGICYGDHRS